MKLFFACLTCSFLGMALGLTAVQAQTVDPALVRAIQLADQGDFPAARDQVAPDDAAAGLTLTWFALQSGNGSFADYRDFTTSYPDWPSHERFLGAAERLLEKGADPDMVIAFFADRTPETGEGAVRLAEALMVKGRIAQAKDVIAKTWVTERLTQSGRTAILENFGDIAAENHVARTDYLLWRWRTDEAALMLPLLDEDQRALAAARIAYIRKRGIDAAVKAVPPTLRNTAGLHYDRYNYLADQGRRAEAVAILKQRSTSATALGEPFRWSGWRRSLARWEMREGRIESAYALAANHYLSDGSAYADLEWLAGYIALRYQGDAALALRHFEAVRDAVDTPISIGRAGYWMARAHEALGDANAAAADYALAAQYQTGFYGLLAADYLGLALDPALTGRGDVTDWEGSDLFENPMVASAVAFLEAGEWSIAKQFMAALGRTLDAHDTGRLAALMQDTDNTYFAVLLGKAAAARGIVVPSAYFPLHPLAQEDMDIDPALALSIARRESEFNIGVGSPVGALGLMQLMPATANEVAGFLSLPYSKPRLTRDWRYNAALGTKYLSMLTEQFGDSPVQIAAGYNAGPSRPEIWMDERGDPRIGEADVVDWIEHIPFRETRNYAMRVTESIPVYRARLTGVTGPVRFVDLLTGNKPIIRPRIRPAVVPVSAEVGNDQSSIISSRNPAVDAESGAPRPVARPAD